jgi:hypothetical protein
MPFTVSVISWFCSATPLVSVAVRAKFCTCPEVMDGGWLGVNVSKVAGGIGIGVVPVSIVSVSLLSPPLA